MIEDTLQFHREMSLFPPLLHAKVNNSDYLYELFRDELFEPSGPPLLDYIRGLNPDECPFCETVPAYSYAYPDEEVGVYVAGRKLTSECQLHSPTRPEAVYSAAGKID